MQPLTAWAGRAVLVVGLGAAIAANVGWVDADGRPTMQVAQGSATAVPVPSVPPSSPVRTFPATASPSAAGTPGQEPLPGGGDESLPGGSPAAGAASEPSATAAPGRFHLHRPGTEVEGDALSGSLASEVYVLKGNVTMHSDPKIDREIAAASESSEPLTVTADEIDVDRIALTYVAKGNVHFVQGTRSGRADLAMLDEQKHTLDLVGDANVYDGERRAAAAKMHYDMLGKDFLGAGDVRIYEPLPTPNPNTLSTPPPKRKRRIPL